MPDFRHSFCDPFKPEVIELGDIDGQEILNKFEQIPWDEILDKVDKAKESEIYFSPSLEFENKTTRHGIVISGVGSRGFEDFYVFYRRPKRIQKLFGFLTRNNPEYLTEITGQTKVGVIEVLGAFIAGNYDFLDNRIK